MVKWAAWYRRYWYVLGVVIIILGVVGLVGSLITGVHDMVTLLFFIISILIGVTEVADKVVSGED